MHDLTLVISDSTSVNLVTCLKIMKSLIFVVFVLAVAVGLAESSLMVGHRLRNQSKENGSFSGMNRQRFVAAMQKTHLYKKGLSFIKWFLREMSKITDHNRYVDLSSNFKKPSTNRWLRYELRA